jgi:hypothetical protein
VENQRVVEVKQSKRVVPARRPCFELFDSDISSLCSAAHPIVLGIFLIILQNSNSRETMIKRAILMRPSYFYTIYQRSSGIDLESA